MKLHEFLTLYQTAKEFYIVCLDGEGEALVIDRHKPANSPTHPCKIIKPFSFENSKLANELVEQKRTICGIVGVKEVYSIPHLIVITEVHRSRRPNDICEPRAKIRGTLIHEISEIGIIPFYTLAESPRGAALIQQHQQQHHNIHHLQLEQPPALQELEKNYQYQLLLIRNLFKQYFYFSYNYDITNSFQRNTQKEPAAAIVVNAVAGNNKYDKRFLWNYNCMQYFKSCSVEGYFLPIIQGFVATKQLTIKNKTLYYTLISRRATARAGTRYNRRGLDHDGNCANFVETEQIIEYNNHVNSFVQIRGSIPLLWSQTPNYSYKPAVVIDEFVDQNDLMKTHFESLLQVYRKVFAVSLIDDTGHEAELCKQFNSRIKTVQKSLPTVEFLYFNFHKECGKMRWHNLKFLLDQIMQEIDDQKYLVVNEKNEVIQEQCGVFRINCIDSLDRTNVVESMIALKVLERQLQQIYLLPEVSMTTFPNSLLDEHYPEFSTTFKNFWTDNADNLSIQYAGTAALKTDFTRTGERTHIGKFKDALNSATRYFHNNFFDDYRQDSIDLYLLMGQDARALRYNPLSQSLANLKLPVAYVVISIIVMYLYLMHRDV